MRKEDTGVWTVEFRPEEVLELLEGLKQARDTEDFTKKIHELEELLGLV